MNELILFLSTRREIKCNRIILVIPNYTFNEMINKSRDPQIKLLIKRSLVNSPEATVEQMEVNGDATCMLSNSASLLGQSNRGQFLMKSLKFEFNAPLEGVGRTSRQSSLHWVKPAANRRADWEL